MKRVGLSMLLAFIPWLFTWADNQKAIEYFIYGLDKQAKSIFFENLGSNTLKKQEQAEAYYYLGEIYYLENQKDSALYYFKQGQGIDPDNKLNAVGEAKILLATNPEAGEKLINDILSGKNKKDVNIRSAIADAYLANNKADEASAQVEEAKKADSKSAAVFLMEGDLSAAKNDPGDACGQYEQAIYFDPQCKEAYIKYARAYSALNYNLAIEMLQKLIEVDKNSYLPYREIGEISFKAGKFDDAAKAYETYIANDEYAYYDYPKYASILFYDGKFDKSASVIGEGLQKDPENPVLLRFQMYNYAELKKHAEGIALADQFMKANQQPIALDHVYYAKLLAANDRSEEALKEYEAALAMDSSKADIYKELAGLYDHIGKYDKASDNYTLFIEKGGSHVKLTDHFALGKAYYSAAGDSALYNTTDTVLIKQMRMDYERKADSVFQYVAEKAPDSYLGNFWRARTNSLLDPETEKGLAKPYYEAAAALLLKSGNKDTRLLVECYSYLGYYYYLQQNLEESKKYWNMILEIDPENAIAKEAIKGMQ